MRNTAEWRFIESGGPAVNFSITESAWKGYLVQALGAFTAKCRQVQSALFAAVGPNDERFAAGSIGSDGRIEFSQRPAPIAGSSSQPQTNPGRRAQPAANSPFGRAAQFSNRNGCRSRRFRSRGT